MQHLHLPSFLPASEPYTFLLPPTTSPTPCLPTSPTSKTLLVRTTHAALNHVDLLYARGQHQNNRSLVVPPFTLGSEFSGLIQDLTPAAEKAGWKKGDAVFGGSLGAFSTHILVDASMVRRVPRNWTLRDSAGLAATLPVAYGCLVECADVQKGETVLVHAGTGGIGVMACQVARALGCRVIATVGSQAKREVCVKELGMEEEDVVDYSREEWEGRVKSRTEGGGGVDVVIDVVGLVEGSTRCCRYGGRIIVVGFAGRGGRMEKLGVNRVLLKGLHLIGYRYGESGRRDAEKSEVIWRGVEELMSKDLIKPVVYHEPFRGLEDVPKAMEAMAQRKVYGKAVIDIAPDRQDGVERAKM